MSKAGVAVLRPYIFEGRQECLPHEKNQDSRVRGEI